MSAGNPCLKIINKENKLKKQTKTPDFSLPKSILLQLLTMTTVAPALTIQGDRKTGGEVRTQNVLAASSVANIVKSSLGPVGLDKMLVDDIGDVTITNDGATILQLLEVEHPAAKVGGMSGAGWAGWARIHFGIPLFSFCRCWWSWPNFRTRRLATAPLRW